MIVVLTSLSYNPAILPAFVEYYAALGVEKVVVSTLELIEGLTVKAKDLTKNCHVPVDIKPASQRWQTTKLEAHNKNELRTELRLNKNDWFVPADLDEFIEFDKKIPDLIDDLKSENCEYAMGTMIDRIANDGSLTTYDPKKPLSEQYPIKANVTLGLQGMDNKKVVLCRGDRSVLSGHHRVVDQAIKKWSIDYVINHYAWIAGRREAIERRIKNYARLNVGSKYPPALRLFDHLDANGGKFNLNDVIMK